MNAGNFIIGLIFGFLLLERPESLKKFVKNWIFYLCIFEFIFIAPTFKLFFQLNQTPSPVISSALGTFLKLIDGFNLSIIFLNLPQKFNFNFLKILEKLFIAAFFSHIAITKIFIASSKVLLEMSALNVVSYETIFCKLSLNYLFVVFILDCDFHCQLLCGGCDSSDDSSAERLLAKN